MYVVIFNDEVHGMSAQYFKTFEEAAEYWQEFADTETCIGGKLYDCDESEMIWEF